MKTIFSEMDLAFKSDDKDELLKMGLEYLAPGKPGLRNELTKMIHKCKNDGFQKGKKSNFCAAYDKKRSEYILYIKDNYEPVYQLAMLFELLTEDIFNSTTHEELEIRKAQIVSYLTLVEKHEELDLKEEIAQLTNLTGQFIATFDLYKDEETLSEEELLRISEKIDLSFFKPISDIIENIMDRFISGNLPISFGLEEEKKA